MFIVSTLMNNAQSHLISKLDQTSQLAVLCLTQNASHHAVILCCIMQRASTAQRLHYHK